MKCACGCGQFAKRGNRFLHGHSGRVPFGRGVTHSDKPARVFSDLDVGKEIGSIFPVGVHKKCYDTFLSPAEAIAWWIKNRKTYMGEAQREYISDGSIRPGSRANIFWELEFAVPYPSAEQAILLIEAHDLWWPGERDKVIAEGKTISIVSRCRMHAFGHPVDFPKPHEAVVRIIDGKLKKGIHPNCEAYNLTYAERETQKKLKNLNRR